MKHLLRSIYTIVVLSAVIALHGCVEAEEFDSTPTQNLEALWRVMDEHYCFFDYKKEQLGVDWDEVHARYSANIDDKLSSLQLFEVMAKMIGELRDGHVNLVSSFDYGRNWSWKESYPANFSDTLQRRYLGVDYHMVSGLQYRVLDDNTAYVYCPSFSNAMGTSSLNNILYLLASCRGLILDIRNNGGGQLTSAEDLAARFTNDKVLVGYMQHKTGPGHNAFSERVAQYIRPAEAVRWQKPVVVLVNRGVYSAANEFTKYMKAIGDYQHKTTGKSLVAIIGDRTGGGAGMPFSAELPNGWGVRFSACPMFDADGNSTEHGIEPHHRVAITDADFARGLDTIIEYARMLIANDLRP